MALLTASGAFTIVNLGATGTVTIGNRQLAVSVDNDDKTLTIHDGSADVIVVTELNAMALNGTTFAQCVTDVDAYMDSL